MSDVEEILRLISRRYGKALEIGAVPGDEQLERLVLELSWIGTNVDYWRQQIGNYVAGNLLWKDKERP